MYSAPALRSAWSMMASCSSRAKPRWLWANVGIPSAAAIFSPRASGWLLATSTISYGQSGSLEWNSSEDIVVPLPESITATRAFSGIVRRAPVGLGAPRARRAAHRAPARALDDLADAHHRFARRLELRSNLARQLGHHREHHSDAA